MTNRPEGYLRSSLMRVTEKLDVPARLVEFLAECRQRRIGQCDRMQVKGELIINIPLIAKSYGARWDINDEVILEAIALIFEKFSYLAVDEIKEAYRQYAAGDLNLGKEAEMWGGEFNVAQMGKILAAYSKNVAAIKAEIHRQEAALKDAKLEEMKREKAASDFEANFWKEFEAKAKSATTWQEIPAFWFAACRRRKWLKMDKETANEILKRATLIAQKEGTENRTIFEKAIISEDRPKVIAQKLAVFEWLKNGMR